MVAGAVTLLIGLAAVGWWIGIAISPAFKKVFVPSLYTEADLKGLILPDNIVFGGAGIIAGIGLLIGAKWAWPVLIFHAAGATFGALYTFWPLMLAGKTLAAMACIPVMAVPLFFVWLTKPPAAL